MRSPFWEITDKELWKHKGHDAIQSRGGGLEMLAREMNPERFVYHTDREGLVA